MSAPLLLHLSVAKNINYDANSDIGLSFLGEDKEAIKSIIWWNAIQDADLENIKGLTKLDSLHLGGINYLKNSLTNGPIEVDFSQLNGLSNPFKLISLKPVRSDYNWAKMFCSFDVRSLEECLK